MSAHCKIEKNSGTAAVEGTVEFSQEVGISAAATYREPRKLYESWGQTPNSSLFPSGREAPHAAKRRKSVKVGDVSPQLESEAKLNPLECRGNYSVTSDNTKLVHWPFMGGLLHLVRRGGDCAGPQSAQAHPRSTKYNRPSINGQCTNHRIAI